MVKQRNKKPNQLNSTNGANDEKPPVLGSWRNIYLAVLLNLAAVMILLYFFSEAFR